MTTQPIKPKKRRETIGAIQLRLCNAMQTKNKKLKAELEALKDQNEALKAEKAELMEALEEATRCLDWHMEQQGFSADKVAVRKAKTVMAKAKGGQE